MPRLKITRKKMLNTRAIKKKLDTHLKKTSVQTTTEFEHIAVYFTKEEWRYLEEGQRELYRQVMMDNYQTICTLGYQSKKPKLISHIEQGIDPCLTDVSKQAKTLDKRRVTIQASRFYGSAKTHTSVAQRLAASVPQMVKKIPTKVQRKNVVKPRKNAKPKNNVLGQICGLMPNNLIVPSFSDQDVQPMNIETPVLENVTNTLNQEVFFLDHVATPGQEDMAHSPRRMLDFTDVITNVKDCQCTCVGLVKELINKVTHLEAELGGQVSHLLGQVSQLQTEIADLKEGLKEQMVEAMKQAIQHTRVEWQDAVDRTMITTNHQAVQVSGDGRGGLDGSGGLDAWMDMGGYEDLDRRQDNLSVHTTLLSVPNLIVEGPALVSSSSVLLPGTPMMTNTPAHRPLYNTFSSTLTDIPLAVISSDLDDNLYRAAQGHIHKYAHALFQYHVTYDTYLTWTNRVNFDGAKGKIPLPNNLVNDIMSRCERRVRIGDPEKKKIRDTINAVLRMRRKMPWKIQVEGTRSLPTVIPRGSFSTSSGHS
ncbi:uncharacterized protein LOC134981038 [Pseudophryne corroboree]|uniref:uncharacterized protein LOC134981038 n=1 Tax=Pseudophryne corroboree TaxID=495146 RepID=UPI0030819FC6